MKSGLIDPQGNMHVIDFYEIQGLCSVMVNKAINESEMVRRDYETNFKNKMTRFSPEFEDCINRLGWMLYDPFCLGNDEVLFSNGKRSFVASLDYISKPGFNRYAIDNDKAGFPILTDETVGYDKDLKDASKYTTGIVDLEGYVSADFVPSLESLAEIELMQAMLKDQVTYDKYLEAKKEGKKPLEFLIGQRDCIAISKNASGKFVLSYAEENVGKVADFIKDLEAADLVADYDVVQAKSNKMIA